MRQQWFTHVRLLIAHPPRYSETSTAALTTPALDRRSLRWFGISAPTATPQDLPPSLAQHGSCQRSSTSSSLPFRTHVGAHNSVVGADQGLRAPSWDLMCRILYRFRRVAGTAGGASRALEGPRDHRPTAPARRAAPPQQPTAAGRGGPGPAWCCRGGPAPTAASRLARHVGDLVALAPAANRQTLDPTLGNAGPTIHLRLASSSHPRNGQRQPHLELPPNHRRARGPRLPRWRGGQEACEPDRSPSSHPTPRRGRDAGPNFNKSVSGAW